MGFGAPKAGKYKLWGFFSTCLVLCSSEMSWPVYSLLQRIKGDQLFRFTLPILYWVLDVRDSLVLIWRILQGRQACEQAFQPQEDSVL